MAFGSYDESEQKDREITIPESDGEDAELHAHDHEGEVSFESGASTADLVDGLGRILDAADEE